MCFPISSPHQWFIFIHLSYSYLTAPGSLFLFPFNTSSLRNQHREVVYSLRLHSDYGRPTTIFYTTFNYPTVINSRHNLPRGREGRGFANYTNGRFKLSFRLKWRRNPSPPLHRQPHPSLWEGVLVAISMFLTGKVSNPSLCEKPRKF